MRTRKNTRIILLLFAAVIGVIALSWENAPFIPRLPRAGILSASFASQQKDGEVSATSGGSAAAPDAASAASETDSAGSLVGDQPVTKEVREAFRKREQELQTREQELERRERTLRELEKTIDAKLAELERRRKDLQALTVQVDETRQAELAAAAKIYKAMDTQSSARMLNQMDLDVVVTVLRQMAPAKSGEILAAMVADVEKMEEKPGGKEAGLASEKAKKTKRLKEIGELLVDPTLRKP
jgi:flagellar motility protein MotE (MotC chaperone)